MSDANKIAAPARAMSVPTRAHQIAKQSFGFLHGVLLRSHRNGQADLAGSIDHVDSSHLAPAGAIGSYTDRHVSSPDLEVPVLVPPRSLDHFNSRVTTIPFLSIQDLADVERVVQ